MKGIVLMFFPVFIVTTLGACVSKSLSLREQARRNAALEELLFRAAVGVREGSERSLAEAHAALALAREISPYDVRVIDGQGCVAWRRKDIITAEHYFRAAIDIDSSFDSAYAHLALVEESKGNTEEARKLYETAISLNPLNYRARNNYAAFLAATDAQVYGKARNEFMKAANIAPARAIRSLIEDNVHQLDAQ